jgi:hypothetical protein
MRRIDATDRCDEVGTSDQSTGPDVAAPLAGRLTITDMQSPAPDTVAGQELARNLRLLVDLGCSGALPLQHVSIFAIPFEHLQTHAVFLAGSPANDNPDNGRFATGPDLDNVAFKEAGFHSMCCSTPHDSVVVMTYSPSACGLGMKFWSEMFQFDEMPGRRRALLVIPAWFPRYDPRLGCGDDREPLADGPDTTVAIYAPPSFLAVMTFWGGRLNVAATIARWLGPASPLVHTPKRIISFGAYTAELEVDIARALELESKPIDVSVGWLSLREADRHAKANPTRPDANTQSFCGR